MNQEQHIREAAEKAISYNKFDSIEEEDVILEYRRIWIDGVKSECARLLWQSQLLKEIERLKDELLEARGLKNRDAYQASLCRAYIKGKN